MKDTLTKIVNTAKNILLVAMIAGIASFIAGANFQAHADSAHIAPVTIQTPAPKL